MEIDTQPTEEEENIFDPAEEFDGEETVTSEYKALPPEFGDLKPSIIRDEPRDGVIPGGSYAISKMDDSVVVTRNRLIRIISAYRAKFPSCRELLEPDLKSWDIPYLQSTLEQYKFVVADQNSSSMFESLMMMTLYFIERGGTKMGLKLEGYFDSCISQPAIVATSHEVAIEMCMEYVIPPMQRLLFLCLVQAYSVHQENCTLAIETSKAMLDKEKVNEETKKKFKDL